MSHDGVRTDAEGDVMKEDDKEEQSEEVKLRRMTPVEVSVYRTGSVPCDRAWGREVREAHLWVC